MNTARHIGPNRTGISEAGGQSVGRAYLPDTLAGARVRNPRAGGPCEGVFGRSGDWEKKASLASGKYARPTRCVTEPSRTCRPQFRTLTR